VRASKIPVLVVRGKNKKGDEMVDSPENILVEDVMIKE